MAFGLGLPSVPFGPNASNNPVRSLAVWSLDRCSERICTVAEEPLPTITTDSGSLPMAFLKTSDTCATRTVPVVPAAGIDTVVPPLKSMPKVNPRIRIDRIATATIAPLIPYQSLRRPTTSNAPVPV